MELVLSLFTGAGLLDRGFRQEGFCVVSAGDILLGQDVREFTPACHKFTGVIGGSPCQEFSKAFRGVPTGFSLEMFHQFARVVTEAQPEWFLLENVPAVPDLQIDGYKIQRFNLNAKEVGVSQNRLRCFQFGSREGFPLVIHRSQPSGAVSRCVLASEGNRTDRRNLETVCELQGLPRNFLKDSDLAYRFKYKIVGNGVPVQMARVIAGAIKARSVTRFTPICICGCGQPVRPGQSQATPACRKRMQRKRDAAAVTGPGIVTPAQSQSNLTFE